MECKIKETLLRAKDAVVGVLGNTSLSTTVELDEREAVTVSNTSTDETKLEYYTEDEVPTNGAVVFGALATGPSRSVGNPSPPTEEEIADIAAITASTRASEHAARYVPRLYLPDPGQ
jgi:hypothetical protein